MSLLHLLGIDDDLSFDGKGLDKTIDNIKGYAKSSFTEDEIDDANSTLEDILASAESINSLEKISDNIESFVDTTDALISDLSSVYKKLDTIKQFIDTYYLLNEKENDELDFIYSETVDAIDELDRNLQFKIQTKDVFGDKLIPYVNFNFIPDFAILHNSNRSGLVCYKEGSWEFELFTYVGYGGLRMTPKSIQYKHLDFCKACDKVFELGIDPENVSDEDYSLLMMLDEHNKVIYDMFKDNRKDK